MSAQEKKVYYNRVRRCCLKHDIEIIYDGVPKMYRAVELVRVQVKGFQVGKGPQLRRDGSKELVVTQIQPPELGEVP